MIGGYKVLDFKGADLSKGMNIPGIYSDVEASIGKPILVRNFLYNNLEVPAFFTTPFFDSNSIFLLRTVVSAQLTRVVITTSDIVSYQIRNLGTNSPSESPNADEPSASM